VIRVDNPSRISTGTVDIDVDGRRVGGDRFPVVDDGREHRVDVRLREADAPDAAPAAAPAREAQVVGIRR
jgi:hypothetical protein